MCPLYAMMRAEAASLGEAMRDRNNNQPPSPGIYCPAPVVLIGEDGQREMLDLGMPPSKKAPTKRADALSRKGAGFDCNKLLK